jgi:WD40 repeat protein
MRIHVKEEECVLLILDFLRQHNFIHAMHALEQESLTTLDTYGQEISFLRNLVLEGAWDDVVAFLKPFEARADFDYKAALFAVKRQRFLEMISSEKLSPAVVELVDGLKELEDKCSRDEFNALCYCLTLKKLQDHPDFRNWTSYRGRLECFESLKPLFSRIYNDDEKNDERKALRKMEPNRLMKLMKDAILFQVSAYQAKSGRLDFPKNQPLYGSLLYDFPENFVLGEETLVSDVRNSVADVVLDAMPRPKDAEAKEKGTVHQSMQLPPRARKNQAASEAGSAASQPQNSGSADQTRSRALHTSIAQPLVSRNAGRRQKPVAFFVDANELHEHDGQANEADHMNSDDAVQDNPSESAGTTMTRGVRFDSPASVSSRSASDSSVSNASKSAMPLPSYLPPEATDMDEPAASTDNIVSASISNPSAPLSNTATPALRHSVLTLPKAFHFDVFDTLHETQAVRTVSFSPFGDTLAIGSNAKTLRVASIAERRPASLVHQCHTMQTIWESQKHHLGSIYCTAFSDDGRFLASGSNDRMIKVCRINSELSDRIPTSISTLEGHTGTVRSLSFIHDSPSGSSPASSSTALLVSAGGGDNVVRLWDVERESCVFAVQDPTFALAEYFAGASAPRGGSNAFHPLSYFCGGGEGTLRMFDFRVSSASSKSACVWSIEAGNDIYAVDASSAGVSDGHLFVGLADGRIMMVDARRGIIDEFFDICHRDECRSVHVSHDGRYLLSSSFDRSMCITDLTTRTVTTRMLDAHADRVIAARWHPLTTDMIVSTSTDKTVKLWRNEAS